jgi:hypothetical protein
MFYTQEVLLPFSEEGVMRMPIVVAVAFVLAVSGCSDSITMPPVGSVPVATQFVPNSWWTAQTREAAMFHREAMEHVRDEFGFERRLSAESVCIKGSIALERFLRRHPSYYRLSSDINAVVHDPSCVTIGQPSYNGGGISAAVLQHNGDEMYPITPEASYYMDEIAGISALALPLSEKEILMTEVIDRAVDDPMLGPWCVETITTVAAIALESEAYWDANLEAIAVEAAIAASKCVEDVSARVGRAGWHVLGQDVWGAAWGGIFGGPGGAVIGAGAASGAALISEINDAIQEGLPASCKEE